MENKTTGIQELEQPEIPRGSARGLSPEVAGSESSDAKSVPGVQDEVAAEKEGTDISKKEKELSSCFVRSVAETETQGHG